jgi:hypothetical protein
MTPTPHQSERDKVLDTVIKWIEREGFYRGMNATYNYIRQLRQQAGDPK